MASPYANFMGMKSFHPGTYRNQLRVYEAQRAAEREDARLKQRQVELDRERAQFEEARFKCLSKEEAIRERQRLALAFMYDHSPPRGYEKASGRGGGGRGGGGGGGDGGGIFSSTTIALPSSKKATLQPPPTPPPLKLVPQRSLPPAAASTIVDLAATTAIATTTAAAAAAATTKPAAAATTTTTTTATTTKPLGNSLKSAVDATSSGSSGSGSGSGSGGSCKAVRAVFEDPIKLMARMEREGYVLTSRARDCVVNNINKQSSTTTGGDENQQLLLGDDEFGMMTNNTTATFSLQLESVAPNASHLATATAGSSSNSSGSGSGCTVSRDNELALLAKMSERDKRQLYDRLCREEERDCLGGKRLQGKKLKKLKRGKDKKKKKKTTKEERRRRRKG